MEDKPEIVEILCEVWKDIHSCSFYCAYLSSNIASGMMFCSQH